MTPRKVKRQRNMEKHEKFMLAYKQDGLKSLKRSRERRDRQRNQKEEE